MRMKKEYEQFELEVIIFTSDDTEVAGSCMASSSC